MKLKVTIYILAFLLLNCKEKAENFFLQQDQIRITQPRLVATNQLIDSVALLTASLKLEDTKIYYTTNGDNPTKQSAEYIEPIKVLKPGVYKFRAFHPDWKESEVVQKMFYKRGLSIDTIVWHSGASSTYKGVGAFTLNNHQKGVADFKDNQWLGFDTIANATMSLKEVTQVKSLSIGYLSNPGSWIFPPEKITIYTSKDGTNFKDKTVSIQHIDSLSAPSLKNIDIAINEDIKYIRVEVKNIESIPQWHEGKGTKAWLFMDEWILK